MNSLEDLSKLMVELLDINVTATPDALTITDRGRQIINEISDFAEQTKIYQDNKERGEMLNDATALQIYGYMLDRIVNAPTRFHMNMSVLLIMPFLRKQLREEKPVWTDN